jgi:hypothetical protein
MVQNTGLSDFEKKNETNKLQKKKKKIAGRADYKEVGPYN